MKDSTKDTFLYEEDRPPIASKPDSTLAILGSITGNFDERVMELIGRIERPPGSRQGWRIPLPPQMATNSGQGIGKGGFGFGIPGSLPCWQMI